MFSLSKTVVGKGRVDSPVTLSSAMLRTAMEEVMTTRFMDDTFAAERRSPSVPRTAGSMKSA